MVISVALVIFSMNWLMSSCHVGGHNQNLYLSKSSNASIHTENNLVQILIQKSCFENVAWVKYFKFNQDNVLM